MVDILPSKERQRPLAYLLLVVALILFYYLFFHRFILSHLALSEQIDQLTKSELRYRAAIAQKPELQEQLAEVRRAQTESDYFLEQENINLASSELTTRLKEVISLHAENTDECQVLSQQNMRNNSDEEFQRVSIKVRMRCELADLSRVLFNLEDGTPYLFVDNLTVFRQVTRRRRNRELVQEKMLDVRFDLSGYISAEPQP